jgi:hypothetical protein
MNVLLTEDGQHYQYPNVGAGRSLVIDIGGFTIDWLAVNPGGEVDIVWLEAFLLVFRQFSVTLRKHLGQII